MTLTRNALKITAAILLLALAQPAVAQQKKGPNGGLLAGKDGHETELIVTPAELTVYLLENGKVEGVKGVALRAVVQESGKNSTIGLSTVDGKKLVGKLAAPLGKGAIVVLTGKDDHGHAVNARYVID